MTTSHLRQALLSGVNAFCDALEKPPQAAASVAPAKAAPTAVKRPPQPAAKKVQVAAAKPQVTLPAPLIPGRKTETPLSASTRKESLKAAGDVAKRLVNMLGANSNRLEEGLRGQLALDRVSFDDAIIKDAIAQAKKA